MAKAIYICYKENPANADVIRERLKTICHEITPPLQSATEPRVVTGKRIHYAITLPTDTIRHKASNLFLGFMNHYDENWYQIKSEAPDGTYVIIRADDNYIEIVTDTAGSRSVWYYRDQEKFIVSTSQIALTRYLNNFRLNKKVIPWMLSSGSLGPGNSWDKRVKKVKPNSTLLLQRDNWVVTESVEELKFTPKIKDYNEAHKLLKEQLNDLFGSVKYDFSKWYLSLSGGYDSRAILFFLKKFNLNKEEEIQTITWGTKESKNNFQSDSFIAKKISEKTGVKNLFFLSNKPEIDYDMVLDRFILSSEGCIDHISGYMDGLELWNEIYNIGCEGVIRGDIQFTSKKFNSEIDVRKTVGLTLCSDYNLLKDYEKWGYKKQEIPQYLQRNKNESYQTWIDRLYLQFRTPVITNSLSDIKYSYVEQSTPLLSKNILKTFCDFSDTWRENKTIFKEIVEEMNVDIPFSKKCSNEKLENILGSKKMISIIKKELSTDEALTYFPEYLLRNIQKNLKVYPSFPAKLSKFVNRLKNDAQLDISYNLIAFRILIILRMLRILENKQ